MTEAQIKEQLNSYRIAKHDMRAALNAIKELEELSTATGSMAPKEVKVMTSLPLSARFEAIIEDKADLEKIIAQEQWYLEEAKELTLQLIVLVKNRQQRRVLTLRYIGDMRYETIAKMMNYSTQNIYKIHRKAIKTIKEYSEV